MSPMVIKIPSRCACPFQCKNKLELIFTGQELQPDCKRAKNRCDVKKKKKMEVVV